MGKCMVCMRDYSETQEYCPYCGYSGSQLRRDTEDLIDILKPGTRLCSERFVIGRVLSYSSDFSILYLAWDELLSRRVVIREYFPYSLCSRNREVDEVYTSGAEQKQSFERGRRAFEEENITLNENQDISEIIHIFRYFQENGTSYSVSEYLEGCTLQDRLNHAKLSRRHIDDLFYHLLEIIECLHSRGIMHLNLSPENIYVLDDNSLKLIDFGETKVKIYRSQRKKDINILDKVYTAPEIISGKSPDTAADIYSLGAIYRWLIAGKEGKLPANDIASRIIRRLMAKDRENRPKNREELRLFL